MLLVGGLRVQAGAAELNAGMGAQEEETFELRMERVLKKDGRKALVMRLEAEARLGTRPYALAWLANYQLYGDLFGVPEIHDEEKGLANARQAMEAGSLFGKEVVGRAMVDGRGFEGKRQPAAGAALLREAAEAGRYTAMGELGKLYLHGYGVPRDLAQAEKWARAAAYRGHDDMLYRFGLWFEKGGAGWSPDPIRACGYYLEAALRGNRDARSHLAAMEKEGVEEARVSRALCLLFDLTTGLDVVPARVKKTVTWLEKTRPEDARVWLAVGHLQMEISQPVYDPHKAWQNLERAAKSGKADARYFLAEMLRRGIGRKKDVPAAVTQLKELAEEGNAYAIGRLGWLHYWGAGESGGLPKDEAEAFRLVIAAAHAGDMWSVLNAAFCFSHGIGTPVNHHLSARYYSIAEDARFIGAKQQKETALRFAEE